MKRNLYTILTLIFIFGCANQNKENDHQVDVSSDDVVRISNRQFEQNKMSIVAVEKRSFPEIVSVNGMIDVPPENRAKVNTIMGGYIKATPLLEGDRVKEGQLLVTLENPDFVTIQQNYMEIKEQLNYLKAEFDRHTTMRKENITSEKNYLMAESNYKTALAKFNGLKKQLTLLNIAPQQVEKGVFTSTISLYAPMNGSITEVNVSRGTYVSPATTIMEIIDNAHIHLELAVFEKDIMSISEKQQIRFKIPEASEDVYEAEVYLVSTVIEEDRTIKVHAHPLEDSTKFLVGMFVEAEIVVNETSSLSVPESAIVEVDDLMYLLLLEEQTETEFLFRKLQVEIGKTVNGFTELKSEQLTKSVRVLNDGAFGLIGL